MKQRVAAVGLTFLLAGCYPMEQAPLVYASKQTIGLSLTGGTTDNPGLDLIIGYKDTNVALVPVVVAKRCPKNSTACEHGNYKLTTVRGEKLDAMSSESVSRSIATAQAEIDRIAKRLPEVNRLLEEQVSIIARSDTQESLRRARVSLGCDNIPSGTPALTKSDAPDSDSSPQDREESKECKDNRAEIDEISISQTDLAAAKLQREKFLLERQELQSSFTANRSTIDILSPRLSGSQSGTRTDAYSVYGTFVGGAGGKPTEGNVNGDRVFATGIAAQNLTESLGFASCLAKIDQIAARYTQPGDAAERKEFIGKALEFCGKVKSDK